MSSHDDAQTPHRSFRLTRGAPAASSQVRTSIVVTERDIRLLLSAAAEQDVSRGGRFSGGPAGVQWWSGPWDGLLGSRGSAEHLGSVDWTYDTPSRHYVTIYRVMLTGKGEQHGRSPADVLAAVAALSGLPVPNDALTTAPGAAADPFRSVRA